jgi:hypothetical protein
MVCAGPATVPLMVMFTFQRRDVARLREKYRSPGRITQRVVHRGRGRLVVGRPDWWDERCRSFGGPSFDGRFRIAVPAVVAWGALCAVCKLRSCKRAGIEAAVGRRRIHLQELTGGSDHIAVLVLGELTVARVDVPLAVFQREESVAADGQSRFEDVGADVALGELLRAVTRRTPSPVIEVLRFTAPDAYTSANSAREPLKPMVLALATLLAVMSNRCSRRSIRITQY